MRRYIYALIIAALILSPISPACKFMSGQSGFMTICDGITSKIIPVPAGYELPTLPDKQKDDPSSKKDSCPFCFAQAHMKPVYVPPLTIALVFSVLATVFFSWLAGFYRRRESGFIYARGPPVTL